VRIVEEFDIQGFDDSISVRTAQGTLSVRTEGGAPHLPVEEIARELLECAGLQVVTGDAKNHDLVLRIAAQGRALTRRYAPKASKTGAYVGDQLRMVPEAYAGDRIFIVPTGFFLQGTVSLEVPGAVVHRKSFWGEARPPKEAALQITHSSFSLSPLFLEYAKPSGREICNRPGSFTQRAVETIGDIFGIPFLLAAIRSKSVPIDEYAANALSNMRIEKSDEDLLTTALEEDEEWRVREQAAEALGRIGGKRAVEPLIAALQDEEYGVRYHAVVALEKLQDPRAVKPFIMALNDGDVQFQNRVLMALKKVTGKDFSADPDVWQEWWEQNMKKH